MNRAFDTFGRMLDAMGRMINGFFGALVRFSKAIVSTVERESRKHWLRPVAFVVTLAVVVGIGLLLTLTVIPDNAWAQGSAGLTTGIVSAVLVTWWLDCRNHRPVTKQINEPAEVPVRKHDTSDGNCLRFEGDPKAPINLSHRCLICNPKTPESTHLGPVRQQIHSEREIENAYRMLRELRELADRRGR
jgi:hypothetical protein